MLLRPRVIRGDKSRKGRQLVATAEEDKNIQAILKWIPVEVIGVYQGVIAAVPSEEISWRLWLTIVGIIICGLWIGFATKPKNRKLAWRQILLAMLAFIFWAAAVQSEVLKAIFHGWQLWMGTVTLYFGTILLPIFDGILYYFGITQQPD